MILGGLILLFLTFWNIVGGIYGLIILILGIIILLNKNEDKIEKRKDLLKDKKDRKVKGGSK